MPTSTQDSSRPPDQDSTLIKPIKDHKNPKTEPIYDAHHGDHGGNIPVTNSVYIFAACAALNSANLGYDIGVNTDAANLVQRDLDLTDVQLELFMGSLNLFAMVGALCANVVTDRFGRRMAFILAAVGFIIGVLIMSLADKYSTLMFGRIFVGLGIGFGFAIDPVYISEISPASHRGMLVTWSEIATNIGIVLGFSSGLIFYDLPRRLAWRCMFGMGAILPAILILCACFIMPESPRWLVQKGREFEAVMILKRLYPDDFDVECVVKDIRESIEKETEAEHAVGWDIIFSPTPAFRRMLLVGIGTSMAQQAVGIDAIQYFLVFILAETGIKSRVNQALVLILLGLFKLGLIIVAGPLFDSKGRRPLFFVSLSGMVVSLLMLSFNFLAEEPNSILSILALALYLSFFSVGMGPGAWLIPSEVFTTTIRAKAMSVTVFLNRITGTFMSSTILTMTHLFSWSGYFFLLALVCVAVTLFLWVYLPETKGKALEDMSLYFAEITGDQSVLECEQSFSASHIEDSLEMGDRPLLIKRGKDKVNKSGYDSVNDVHG